MAYGFDSGYGTSGGGEQDTQANAAQQIQKQRQTPYAGKTGQALASQAQKPVSSTYTRGTSNSPVTADGKINEQNGPPPQTQPAPAPAPAPAPVDRNAVVQQLMKDTGKNEADATAWAERYGYFNPQQQAAQRNAAVGQAVAPGTGATGGQGMPGTQPVGPQQWAGVNTALGANGLPMRPGNTQWQPGTLPQYQGGAWEGGQVDVYNGGAWNGAQLAGGPMQQYGGSQFDQYKNIDQSQLTGASKNALMSAIDGPGPVNPELLKAAAKDDSLAMMGQLGSQSRDAMAARGLAGGGADAAAQTNIQEQGVSDLLKNYRGIEIDAATKNRDALLNAISAAEGVQSGEVSRAGQQYQNTLAGQAASAADKQAAIASQNNANKFDFDKSLAQAGLDQAKWQSGITANNARMAGQLTNADLSKQQWQSGLDAHQAALQGALAQEGLDSDAAKLNSSNFSDDTKSILTKMGFDVDKYKTDQNTQVGMAGVAADRYGHGLNFTANMAAILENARANDQNTGVNWGKILSGSF